MRDSFSDWESGRCWDQSTAAMSNKRVKSTTSSSSSSSSSTTFTSREEATTSEKDKAMAVASLMDFDGRDHQREDTTGGGGMLSSSNDHHTSSMGMTTTGTMSSKEALKERKKVFSGYKNIVSQASQLYNEWRSLYDTVILDTVRANSTLGMIQGGQGGLSSAKLSTDQLHLVDDTTTATLLRTKSTSSRSSSNGKKSRDKSSSSTSTSTSSIPTVGYSHPNPFMNQLFHPSGVSGHSSSSDGWTTSASSSSSSSYGSGNSSTDASLNCDNWTTSVNNNNMFTNGATWQPAYDQQGPGMLPYNGREQLQHMQQLQPGGMYRHNGVTNDHHHDNPHVNGTMMQDMVYTDKMGQPIYGQGGNVLGGYGNEEDVNILSMQQGRGVGIEVGVRPQSMDFSHSGIHPHGNGGYGGSGGYGGTGGMTTYAHVVHNGSATDYSHSFPMDPSANSLVPSTELYSTITSSRREVSGSEMMVQPGGDQQPSSGAVMVVSESEKSGASLPTDGSSGPSGQVNHQTPVLPSYVQSSPYFTGLGTVPGGMSLYPTSENDGGGNDGVHQNGVFMPPSASNNHLMHPLLPVPVQGLGRCFYDTQEVGCPGVDDKNEPAIIHSTKASTIKLP